MNSVIFCPEYGKCEFGVRFVCDTFFSNGASSLCVIGRKPEHTLFKRPSKAEKATTLKEKLLESFCAVQKLLRDGGRAKKGIACGQPCGKEPELRAQHAQSLCVLDAEKNRALRCAPVFSGGRRFSFTS